MKKIIIAVLIVAQIACKKNNSPSEPTSSFGFKANANDFNWNCNSSSLPLTGAQVYKNPNSGGLPGGYMLHGFDSSQGVVINCFMETSSLSTTTYRSVTTSSTGYIQSSYEKNKALYAPINLGDSVVVTILAISNNRVSGSFSAVMHDLSTSSMKIEISKGYFNNVLIAN